MVGIRNRGFGTVIRNQSIGTRYGKRLIFDVGDCDRRLLQFKNQKDTYGNN